MTAENVPDFSQWRFGDRSTKTQVVIDFPKNPGAPLGGPTDHDGVSAGLVEYLLRLVRTVDITIGKYRDGYRIHHGGYGVVFRLALIAIGPRPAVYGQGLNADILRHPCHAHRIAIIPVPAGAYFQGDRQVGRRYHCLQYIGHQRLISE